jgi:membrane protein implicated in regulation of membrane protease activity
VIAVDIWVIWFVAALVLGISEMFVGTFYLLWIGVSCVLAGLVALLFPDWVVAQFVVASLAAVALSLNSKRLTRRWTAVKGHEDSPFEHLIGSTALVTEWDASTQLAIVRIGSEQWSARCDRPLEIGSTVEVVAGHSSILTVKVFDN